MSLNLQTNTNESRDVDSSWTFDMMKNRYMNIIDDMSPKEASQFLRGHLLYVYFDDNEELMYVGITNDINKRHNTHKDKHKNSGHYIAKFDTRKDAEFYERFLVQKCNPYKNRSMKTADQISFELPGVDFISFDHIKEHIKVEKKTTGEMSEWKKKQIMKNLEAREHERLMNQNFMQFLEKNKSNIVSMQKNEYNNTEIEFNQDGRSSYFNEFGKPWYRLYISNYGETKGYFCANLVSSVRYSNDALYISLTDGRKRDELEVEKILQKIYKIINID